MRHFQKYFSLPAFNISVDGGEGGGPVNHQLTVRQTLGANEKGTRSNAKSGQALSRSERLENGRRVGSPAVLFWTGGQRLPSIRGEGWPFHPVAPLFFLLRRWLDRRSEAAKAGLLVVFGAGFGCVTLALGIVCFETFWKVMEALR